MSKNRTTERLEEIDKFLQSSENEKRIDIPQGSTEKATIIAYNRTIYDSIYFGLCHVGYNELGELVLARAFVKISKTLTEYMQTLIESVAESGVKKALLDTSKFSSVPVAYSMASSAINKLGLKKSYRAHIIDGEVIVINIESNPSYTKVREDTKTRSNYATLYIWSKVSSGKDYTDEAGHVYKIADWCAGKTPDGIRVYTKAGRYLGVVPAKGEPYTKGEM